MELLLDCLIIILIAVMIGYSIILNIKLKTFRNSQSEMAALVGQLNNAILGAQTSIEVLKKTAQQEEGRLESLISKSRMLADELDIIIQSGTNIADRIERGLIPPEKIDDDTEHASFEDSENEEDSEMLENLRNVR